jgi:hypothetical protein
VANVQKFFERFHERIRTDYETNKELRDKRDIILDRITNSLEAAGHPSFERLMQGSYIMRTGVFPTGEKEYDIDVGLRFAILPTQHTAQEVRGWVYDAVKNHTDEVEAKGPCIRVRYAKGFHVDLVAYACWDEPPASTLYRLAHETNGWVPADPPTLINFVYEAQAKFAGTEGGTQTTQLRRVVRYLKRWDDVWQPEESDAKPAGLAFTLLAVAGLTPLRTWDGAPDDRAALHAIATQAVQHRRVEARKPTPQYEDMFGRLTEKDMSALIKRFGEMRDALDAADREVDPSRACSLLARVFGSDFPVPPPDETGEKTKAPAIVSSSASG